MRLDTIDGDHRFFLAITLGAEACVILEHAMLDAVTGAHYSEILGRAEALVHAAATFEAFQPLEACA